MAKDPDDELTAILLDIFDNSAIPVAQHLSAQWAREFADEMKERIHNGSIEVGHQYNEKYLKYKEAHGIAGDTPFILTGDYVDSIDVVEVNGTHYVGVWDKEHEGRGDSPSFSMRSLARSIEFGNPSINMPARPHWRPTLTRFLRRKEMIRRQWDDEMAAAVRVKTKMYEALRKEMEDEDSD
jgi:hypothetical protein